MGYCYRTCSVVCQSVRVVSPAKTAELIVMPFGLRTWVGPRNRVLDGAQESCIKWVQIPHGKVPFSGERLAHCKVQGQFSTSCSKMAELIEVLFRIWTRVDHRKHVLGGVHTGATWRIPLNRPCAAAMWPIVKLLWPLVFNHYHLHAMENLTRVQLVMCKGTLLLPSNDYM